jgi:hypothetical protein
MRDLSGDKFKWRTEVYEFVKEPIAIDLLFGSDRERRHLEAGKPWQELPKLWVSEEADFRMRSHSVFLYD